MKTKLTGLILIALLQAACAPGFDLREDLRLENATRLAQGTNFSRALESAPARLQAMAAPLQNNLSQASAQAPAGCAPALPVNGSTAQAINAALKAGAKAICAEAGRLDEAVTITDGVSLFLGAGEYEQSAPLTLQGNRVALVGATAFGTILKMSAPGPQVQIGDFVDYYRVANLSLIRTHGDLAVGDNGVRTGKSNNNGVIEALWIEKQFDGLYLGVTAYSQVRDISVNECARHGLVFTNLQHPGPTQYYMRDLLFTRNDGFAIYASPDSGQMSVGNWDGIYTFHNKRGGVVLTTANGHKVESLRMTNSFFGNDGYAGGGAEIAIHGGSLHAISNTFIEMSGFSGLDFNTIANDTPGIYLAAGVNTVNMSNLMVVNSSGPGVLSAAQNVLISASTFANNGHRGRDDRNRSGIHNIGGGTMTLTGNQFPAIGAEQRVAIFNDGAAGSIIESGNRIDTSGGMIAQGNASAPVAPTPPPSAPASFIRTQFDLYLPGCWTAEKESIWQTWFNNGGTQADFIWTLQNVATTNPSCLVR